MAVEDLYDRACQAVERGNFGYAVKLFREVLRHEPEFQDARAAMRMCERRAVEQGGSVMQHVLLPLHMAVAFVRGLVGGPQKRLEAYEDFLEKHPNSFWGLMGAAGAARKAGSLDAAIEMYRDALRFKPNSKRGLRKAAEVHKDKGENGEAAKCLARLVQMEPQNRDLLNELRDLEAAEHITAGRYEEAESFRDTIRDKELASELEESQRMAVATTDLEREIRRLETELEKNPTQVNRILRLSRLYEDNDEPEKALELLREKVKLLPDNYEVGERLGDVRLAILDREIAALAAKLAESPDDDEVRGDLEELREKRNEFALQEYRRRLAEHPTDRDIQQQLGQLYFETGDYNAAIATFQGLTQAARYEVRAREMLGRCFVAKGQYDLAVDQFQQAMQRHGAMDDLGKELRYFLAHAHEEAGQQEDALRVYKEIYSQDINYRDVAEKVDALS